jgi:hypothetical protein
MCRKGVSGDLRLDQPDSPGAGEPSDVEQELNRSFTFSARFTEDDGKLVLLVASATMRT